MSCTGACCAAFTLSRSVAELAAGVTDDDLRIVPEGDGAKVAAMVIPLSTEEAIERRERFDGESIDPAGDVDWFTCRHWDESTRLCGIYEERPDMCRDYPYGTGCEHGCDCEGVPRTEAELAA